MIPEVVFLVSLRENLDFLARKNFCQKMQHSKYPQIF
jgi:hypothetical protein